MRLRVSTLGRAVKFRSTSMRSAASIRKVVVGPVIRKELVNELFTLQPLRLQLIQAFQRVECSIELHEATVDEADLNRDAVYIGLMLRTCLELNRAACEQ